MPGPVGAAGPNCLGNWAQFQINRQLLGRAGCVGLKALLIEGGRFLHFHIAVKVADFTGDVHLHFFNRLFAIFIFIGEFLLRYGVGFLQIAVCIDLRFQRSWWIWPHCQP